MMTMNWKNYLPLTQKSKRHEQGKFIVEGVRLCKEALLSDWEVEVAFVTEAFKNHPHWAEFQEYLQQKKIPFQVINTRHFKQLAETQTPQGILLIIKFPAEEKEQINLQRARFLVVLQGVRDPGNLGTIIRTADWFGCDGVLLSDDCVDPFNGKVLRATMGSIFHLPVIEVENLRETIARLRKQHFFVVASSLTAEKGLHQARFRKPIALILGGEAQGISADLAAEADLQVRIWKFGQAESLNVAVAGGILMNHIALEIFKPKR